MRLARAFEPLPPGFPSAFGRAGAHPAWLEKQTLREAFGPLLQGPLFHPHGQRSVQQQAAAAAIADRTQVLRGRMSGIVQFGSVLDQQIFARLPATGAGGFPMRGLHLDRSHLGLAEKAVGRFEFLPVRQGLRQGAAGILRQARGEVHQPLGAALVAQRGQRKFLLRPLGRRG